MSFCELISVFGLYTNEFLSLQHRLDFEDQACKTKEKSEQSPATEFEAESFLMTACVFRLGL